MRLYEKLKQIEEAKVIAIIRADNVEEAVKCAEACIRGGIKTIEVTYTIPQASKVIESIYDRFPNAIVGAGTILEAMTAKIAIEAGANFIVSPHFQKDIATLCNLYQVPYFPGCMTVTEMTTALSYGCSVIKLFPSSQFGPSSIKQFQGPLPQLSIIPTGSIDMENISEWLKEGAFAIGIGSSLTKGTVTEIENKANMFVKRVEDVVSNGNNV